MSDLDDSVLYSDSYPTGRVVPTNTVNLCIFCFVETDERVCADCMTKRKKKTDE